MELRGLSSQQAEQSRKEHGSNELTQMPPEPLWKKILEGFKDPMIMILLVALVIQVILFFLGQAEWFEPFGILVAILIANGVASVSENKQEGKASVLLPIVCFFVYSMESVSSSAFCTLTLMLSILLNKDALFLFLKMLTLSNN